MNIPDIDHSDYSASAKAWGGWLDTQRLDGAAHITAHSIAMRLDLLAQPDYPSRDIHEGELRAEHAKLAGLLQPQI